jgi:hypothetical protein
MNVREIVRKVPYLCKSKNADRESVINEFQFNDELNKPNSVFAKNKLDLKKPYNRLKTVVLTGKFLKVWHCKNIAKLLLLNHYKKEHNENKYNGKIIGLKAAIAIGEVLNPEIKKEIPLKEITTKSEWDG